MLCIVAPVHVAIGDLWQTWTISDLLCDKMAYLQSDPILTLNSGDLPGQKEIRVRDCAALAAVTHPVVSV